MCTFGIFSISLVDKKRRGLSGFQVRHTHTYRYEREQDWKKIVSYLKILSIHPCIVIDSIRTREGRFRVGKARD